MDSKIIVHISEVDISLNSGMGRVEWHWKRAFEERGYTFVHIGPAEIGSYSHPGLFPFKAKKHFQSLGIKPLAFIVHEPAAGLFVGGGIPCFVESHGVEQRYWDLWMSGKIEGLSKPTLKSQILFPLWRLFLANRGLKKATALLLINKEDKEFVQNKYKRKDADVFVFDNGVDLLPNDVKREKTSSVPVLLFNASWLPRKGIFTLAKALQKLSKMNVSFRLLLIGTGTNVSEKEIHDLLAIPNEIEIIPRFKSEEEIMYLNRSDIFILPSFYEGKPLSLLQAMAAGLCCITTNTCGQSEMIRNEQNGLLFEKGDSEGLVMALKRVIENEELRERLSNQAKMDVQTLTWQNVSRKVVEFISNKLGV